MGALCDRPADLVEMGLHGVRVGEGHGERRADAPSRADRSEQIGALVALIGGLRGLVPRLAHCRTRPFFWPMRASSWNQSSIGLRFGRWARWAFSVVAKLFKSLDRALVRAG